MLFSTGNQQLGNSPSRVKPGNRSCSFQATFLCWLLSPPSSYLDDLTLWALLSTSEPPILNICSFNLIRWFLGSDYRNISVPNKFSDLMVSQKRTGKQSCRMEDKSECTDIYIYIHIIKVMTSNAISWFGEGFWLKLFYMLQTAGLLPSYSIFVLAEDVTFPFAFNFDLSQTSRISLNSGLWLRAVDIRAVSHATVLCCISQMQMHSDQGLWHKHILT